MGGLAAVHRAETQPAKAVELYEITLEKRRKTQGPNHPDTLWSRATLARALNGQGKYAEADTQFRDVIKIQEKVEGPESSDTLDSYYYFAFGLKRQNKLEEAKEFARRAAEGARKVLGLDHPSTQKYTELLQELKTPR